MTEHTFFFRTSDDTTLWVERRGEGRPLILLHGWHSSSRVWERNINELARQRDIITVDFRGHGRSQKTLTGHTPARYARDVHELITALGLQDVVLIGWGLGATVALMYWQDFGREGRVTALGLWDMTPFPYSDAGWNSHELAGFQTQRATHLTDDMLTDRDTFLQHYFRRWWHHHHVPAGAESLAEDLRATPPWIALAIYSAYLLTNTSDILPTVTVPTLLLATDNDIFPQGLVQAKYLLSRLPRGTLHELTGGHAFFYEDPAACNELVLTFSRNQRGGFL